MIAGDRPTAGLASAVASSRALPCIPLDGRA
jgi:hypothetical protein